MEGSFPRVFQQLLVQGFSGHLAKATEILMKPFLVSHEIQGFQTFFFPISLIRLSVKAKMTAVANKHPEQLSNAVWRTPLQTDKKYKQLLGLSESIHKDRKTDSIFPTVPHKHIHSDKQTKDKQVIIPSQEYKSTATQH